MLRIRGASKRNTGRHAMHLTITLTAIIALAWAGIAAFDAVQDMPRWVEGSE